MIADKVTTPSRRVTDAPTRMFHWLFALCFTGAYLSSESERAQVLHAVFGYSMVALLAFRLIYGWLGPLPVRWSSLIKKLMSGWGWCRSFQLIDLFGANLRSAQNFALVLATCSLLVLSVPLILSGHVLYVGSLHWLEAVHELMANLMLLCVLAHLALLLLISILRGTNLAMPMLRGRVPGTGPDLVTSPRLGLALGLLIVSIALGLWAVL
ncbi:MAG: cytochrome b/b6 domain-containing protein [Betaproteobacteria bacterium]|jgi:cytochrome b